MKKKFKFWQVIKLFSEDRIESAYRRISKDEKIELEGGPLLVFKRNSNDTFVQNISQTDMSGTWYVKYKNERNYDSIIVNYTKPKSQGQTILVSTRAGEKINEQWARLLLSEHNRIVSIVGFEKDKQYILDESFLKELAEEDEDE